MEQIRKPVAGEQYLEAFAVMRATKALTSWLLLVCIVLSVAAFLLVRWTKLLEESESFKNMRDSAAEVATEPRQVVSGVRQTFITLASDSTPDRPSLEGLSEEELQEALDKELDEELARMAAQQEAADGDTVDTQAEPEQGEEEPQAPAHPVPVAQPKDQPDRQVPAVGPSIPLDEPDDDDQPLSIDDQPQQSPPQSGSRRIEGRTTAPTDKRERPSATASADVSNKTPPSPNRGETIYQVLGIVLPIVKMMALVSAVLLTVSLLLALMVICAGRLGGAGQVASAFIWSALLLLILVPWDAVFGTDFIPGVLAGREELVIKTAAVTWGAEPTWLENVVYYLRFIGWPALAVMVWIMVQLRFDRGCRQVFLGALPTHE